MGVARRPPGGERDLRRGHDVAHRRVECGDPRRLRLRALGTIVDVGGGNRTLLASILEAHPSSRGILFDQEHVVSRAKPVLQAAARLHHARRERDAVFEAVAA
jgi:hypothetical protein